MNIKHNWSRTRLYSIWADMKTRCTNPKHPSYKNYGAKGISICEEWLDYPAFMTWALSHGYEDTLTIERKDSSLGYNPDNCEWITKAENTVRAKARTFVATSPEGKVYRGFNLREFCREHKLHQGHMSAVARGDQKQHKNWTVKYV